MECILQFAPECGLEAQAVWHIRVFTAVLRYASFADDRWQARSLGTSDFHPVRKQGKSSEGTPLSRSTSQQYKPSPPLGPVQFFSPANFISVC